MLYNNGAIMPVLRKELREDTRGIKEWRDEITLDLAKTAELVTKVIISEIRAAEGRQSRMSKLKMALGYRSLTRIWRRT